MLSLIKSKSWHTNFSTKVIAHTHSFDVFSLGTIFGNISEFLLFFLLVYYNAYNAKSHIDRRRGVAYGTGNVILIFHIHTPQIAINGIKLIYKLIL